MTSIIHFSFFLVKPIIQGVLAVEFLKDLWNYIRRGKRYWLVPILVSLLVFGAFITLAGQPVVAPFIYALF